MPARAPGCPVICTVRRSTGTMSGRCGAPAGGAVADGCGATGGALGAVRGPGSRSKRPVRRGASRSKRPGFLRAAIARRARTWASSSPGSVDAVSGASPARRRSMVSRTSATSAHHDRASFWGMPLSSFLSLRG